MFNVLAGAAAVGLGAGGFALTRPLSKVVGTEPHQPADASPRQLEVVAGLNVFFGHQSVGGNVIAALPQVFAAAGVAAPEIVNGDEVPSDGQPVFLHANVGRNRDPLGKLSAFDRFIRSGVGDAIDVGAFKLCYADIVEGSDIEQIFAAHRDTIAALQRDYPHMAFIVATVPLTVEPDDAVTVAKVRIKRLLDRQSSVHPANNVARERYNAMIRAEYGRTGRLWDIAALQSTVDGNRRVRKYGGDILFAMEPLHASDPGHLNPNGAAVLGRALMALIADAAQSER